MQEVINRVNANKVNDNRFGNIRQQNVVMGLSMGGLCARYALANMTKNFPATPTEARLLITHDSPHKGANVPLGLQYMIRMLGGVQLFGYNVFDVYPDYNDAIGLLNAPATQQLLLYRATTTNAFANNTFLDAIYRPMITFGSSGPQPTYRFIATANGNECANPLFAPGKTFINLGAGVSAGIFARFLFFKVPILDYKLAAAVEAYALPASGSTNKIAKVYAENSLKLFGFINVFKQLYDNTAYAPGNHLAVDGVPGSNYPLLNVDALNQLTNLPIFKVNLYVSFPLGPFLGGYFGAYAYNSGASYNFTFVPVGSALDVSPYNNSTFTQKYVNGLNPIYPSGSATFIAQETVQGQPSQTNNTHIRFTARNSRWMFNEMEGVLPNNENCSNECSPTASDFSINGINPLCTSSIYSVRNIPANATVVWSATPSSIVTISPINGNQANVTINQIGDFTLRADVSNGCAQNPIPVFKTIHAGIPVIPYFANPGQAKQMSPGVWNGIVKFISTGPDYPYTWKVDGNVMPNSTGSTVNFSISDCNGLGNFYQDYTITASATNVCGTSELCAVYRYSCSNSGTTKTLNYYNPCNIVNRPAPTRYVLSKDSAVANHLEIDVATLSEDNFAHLYPDPDSLNTELVQDVAVYNVAGIMVQQVTAVAAKTTSIDLSGLPEGNYNVVVGGNNDYTEQQTYKFTVVKTEQQLAEEIATGNYTIPTPDEADRKEVLRQQLFKELLDKQSLVNASTILQNFLATKDQENYGFIRKITEAFDNGDTAAVSVLLNQWVPQNQQDQNCIDYFNLYLRLLANEPFTYTDISNLYDLANRCPLKDGEIIYAARSLYKFMTESSESFEYACDGAANRGATKRIAAAKSRYLPTTTKVYPNPAKGSFNIDFPATEKGQSTIVMTDVFGKKVLEKTVSQRLNNISLPTGTASGIYMIHITNQKTGQQQTQKIVVKR